MNGFIPENLIEEVRSRADIVEVISQYVLLTKKGRYYVGLCPFHNEKTPSFTVTPEKQIFHCFGCRAGGNVFKFIMLKENLTFPEAVRHLGRATGVSIEENIASPQQRQRLIQREKFFTANELAKEFFQRNLYEDSGSGAHKYLHARGLSRQIAETFQMGFALPGWNTLLNYFLERGYNQQNLVKQGLVVEGKQYYDRFRNRLIFPICDQSGRVAGFGGRVLDDGQPKYLNSPESDYFVKRKLLYGLHLAKNAIREQGFAVLTEGYLDVITAHQYGFLNVVAPLGTSLTAEQCKLLARYTREVTVVFDADAAGAEAALRGVDTLRNNGLSAKVAEVPSGKDPDEFIRKQGPEAWENLIACARSFVEYKLIKATAGKNTSAPAIKIEVIRQLLPYISDLGSALEKEEHLKHMASYLNVSWEVILSEFKNFEANRRERRPISDNIVKKKHNILLDARERAEQGLLQLLADDSGLITTIESNLPENFFKRPAYQEIYNALTGLGENQALSVAYDKLGTEAQEVFTEIFTKEVSWDDPGKVFADLVKTLQNSLKRERQEVILKKLSVAENEGNKEMVNMLLQELQNIKPGNDIPDRKGE